MNLRVSHFQGSAPPFVVLQPLMENEEEVSAEKTKMEDPGAREDRDTCSPLVVDGSIGDGVTETSISAEDQKESSSSGSNSNVSNNLDESNDSSNSGMGQERPLRPAKRKQATDKSSSYKRPRGILKLRSKTIRIMK